MRSSARTYTKRCVVRSADDRRRRVVRRHGGRVSDAPASRERTFCDVVLLSSSLTHPPAWSRRIPICIQQTSSARATVAADRSRCYNIRMTHGAQSPQDRQFGRCRPSKGAARASHRPGDTLMPRIARRRPADRGRPRFRSEDGARRNHHARRSRHPARSRQVTAKRVEPVWLDVQIALAVHDRQLAEHGEARACATRPCSNPRLRGPGTSGDMARTIAARSPPPTPSESPAIIRSSTATSAPPGFRSPVPGAYEGCADTAGGRDAARCSR